MNGRTAKLLRRVSGYHQRDRARNLKEWLAFQQKYTEVKKHWMLLPWRLKNRVRRMMKRTLANG